MMTNLFDNSTLPMLEQVVEFTQARHGVLAGNIANLDTPGYRTRDLSPAEFKERLKEAIDERREPSGGPAPYPYLRLNRDLYERHATSSTQRIAPQRMASTSDAVEGMLRHDENNASLEEQVSEIAKNKARHDLALSLMNAQFRLLRAAITERV